MVREIVTIQLGSLSNYIAAHFWNAQEAYFTYDGEETSPVDHDIHWRQGLGADGSETFLPRTLVYDFKAGFGSLGKTNPLYEDQNDGNMDNLWQGSPAVHRQPAVEPSLYQQSLDTGAQPPKLTTATVRYWSDFSRVFFHPRSLIQLSELQLSPAQASFDDWAQGRDLFQALDGEQDFLDNHLRHFTEECDLLQGMQMMATIDDGWGGFASSFLERIRDEYPKSCVWLWAPENAPAALSREKRHLCLQNKARCLTEAWEQASAVVPLSLPKPSLPAHVMLDPSSPWHVSALFSTAIETATLPSRLTPSSGEPGTTLDGLASSLNIQGKHTIFSLLMGIGGGLAKAAGSEPPEGTLNINLSTMHEMATASSKKAEASVYSQILTQRGGHRIEDELDAIYKSLLPHEEGRKPPPTARYRSTLGYPILDSYPEIYQAVFRDEETSISVDTLLSTDSSISMAAKVLRTGLLPTLRADDREALGNSLSEIQDEYRGAWSSGSDDDDD